MEERTFNRTFIRHNYHDHGAVTMHDYLISQLATLSLEDIMNKSIKLVSFTQGGVTIPFPVKLHLVISISEREGFGDIISWQPHGRCFHVHKPQEFVDKVLSCYFGQTKITSFQRQLNMYGFLRLTKGPDKGCYYHELFLRHKLFLCQDITRFSVKGTGVKIKIDHSTEPNFYAMPFVEPDPELPREIVELSKQYESQLTAKQIPEVSLADPKTVVRIDRTEKSPEPDQSNQESNSRTLVEPPNTLISSPPPVDQSMNCSSPIIGHGVDWKELDKHFIFYL
ncbi:hypothetical protein ACHAXS_000919 [Conticribra weissflogii]